MSSIIAGLLGPRDRLNLDSMAIFQWGGTTDELIVDEELLLGLVRRGPQLQAIEFENGRECTHVRRPQRRSADIIRSTRREELMSCSMSVNSRLRDTRAGETLRIFKRNSREVRGAIIAPTGHADGHREMDCSGYALAYAHGEGSERSGSDSEVFDFGPTSERDRAECSLDASWERWSSRDS